jgi:hypothetical protein
VAPSGNCEWETIVPHPCIKINNKRLLLRTTWLGVAIHDAITRANRVPAFHQGSVKFNKCEFIQLTFQLLSWMSGDGWSCRAVLKLSDPIIALHTPATDRSNFPHESLGNLTLWTLLLLDVPKQPGAREGCLAFYRWHGIGTDLVLLAVVQNMIIGSVLHFSTPRSLIVLPSQR